MFGGRLSRAPRPRHTSPAGPGSGDGSGFEVILSAIESESLYKTSDFTIQVDGLATWESAQESAPVFEAALKRALVSTGVGGDLGERSASSFLTEYGCRYFAEKLGVPVVEHDRLGAHVYEVGSRPKYVGFKADPRIGRSTDRLGEEFIRSCGLGPLNPRQKVAFDLFSTSQFLPEADGRFLLLFMALEALVELQPRDEAAQTLVDELEGITRDALGLGDADRSSILGSLGWLRKESIRQGGLRVCRELGDCEIDGWAPSDLYNESYRVRNGLTHPRGSLPTREAVSNLIGPLQKLVQAMMAK